MAHGSPRINICMSCNRYILVPRFSPNPDCPDCGKESGQTSREKLRDMYNLGILYEFKLAFNSWSKI